MTNKYWVGGSGNWSDDDNHWATSSGGTPADGNLPTASDNVFFDSNSHTTDYTVTIDATTKLCLDLTFAAPASGNVTWAGSVAMTVSGSITCYSGLIRTYTGAITMNGTGAHTITTAGTSMRRIIFNGTGSFTLQDNFTATGIDPSITVTQGTVDFNDKDLSVVGINGGTSTTRVLSLGNGTITCTTNNSPWNFASVTNITLNAEGSTIKFTNSTSGAKTFAGGGLTYNNFENATTGTGHCIITGSNTFNTFTISTASRTQKFTAGTTTTISSLVATQSGTVITSATAATHTLVDTSGTNAVQNCTISYSIASGGATWDADTDNGNVDGGNNTGWDFGVLPFQLQIGDAWKEVPAMQINIGDVWKEVAGAQLQIGDAWKTIF